MSDDTKANEQVPPPPKKRSLTSLSLQWLAERMRKAERIKAELAAGKYQVSSAQVAESLVSEAIVRPIPPVAEGSDEGEE